MGNVQVQCTASRGYHLVIPADVENLPKELVQGVKNSKTISCTTQEVMNADAALVRILACCRGELATQMTARDDDTVQETRTKFDLSRVGRILQSCLGCHENTGSNQQLALRNGGKGWRPSRGGYGVVLLCLEDWD